MRHPKTVSVSAAVLSLLAAGCASNARHEQRAAVGPDVQCPPNHTLTCEARTTGRIFQGSFRKDNDRCACVPEGFELPESPVIPAVQ